MSGEYELFLRELTSEDPLARVHGLEGLEGSEVLHEKRVLERVRRLLSHDSDWLVRVSAAEALGAFGDTSPDTLASLTTALETDGAPLVRAYAAESLAELNATGSTKSIRGRLLREQEPHARASMLMALAKLGDPSSLRVLLDLLEEVQDWETQTAILHMLQRLVNPENFLEIERSITDLREARPQFDHEHRWFLQFLNEFDASGSNRSWPNEETR